ncbi:MAG: hypothetical protein CM15mP69_6430 [Ectothiorhodospiraceae bacterium]|nr:MAG: hypothetical protein CM15mP69_6430 [Ectothiorhodospiraceae bacterium]
MNEQSDHIVSSFDDDIASIRMSVIKMATLVEEQYSFFIILLIRVRFYS